MHALALIDLLIGEHKRGVARRDPPAARQPPIARVRGKRRRGDSKADREFSVGCALRSILAAAGAILLSACGSHVAEILPPNVDELCQRAIDCEAFAASGKDACDRCVDTVADQWNAEANEAFDGHPPELASLPCPWVRQEAQATNLDACVAGDWYGKKRATP